jgi:hypothetical protein
VAAYLATNNMIIVGDYAGWVIETDTTTIKLDLGAALHASTSRIPLQRSEPESASRSVWK